MDVRSIIGRLEPRLHSREYDAPLRRPIAEHELMRILGFDPGFRGVPGCPPGRGRGRTTMMLVRAAIAAQFGRVLVLGFSTTYTTELQNKCRSMCRLAGIDLRNVVSDTRYNNHPRWGGDEQFARYVDRMGFSQVFRDHYYGPDYDFRPQIMGIDPGRPSGSVAVMRIWDDPMASTEEQAEEQCLTCMYHAKSKHLRCAVYPVGDVAECAHFDSGGIE